MKLTSTKYKIGNSISDSIIDECIVKTNYLTSDDIWFKITDEIRRPNLESIENIQRRILDKLKNEIN